MCGPDFPQNISIANPVPHVTLLQGYWDAVASNDVLISVFTNNGTYTNQYQAGLFNNNQSFHVIQKIPQVWVKGEKVDIYMLKVGAQVNLTAVTKYIYSATKKNLFE